MQTKTVNDFMSRKVHTLGRNDNLSAAEELMRQEQIRHIVVLDENGDLCGVVTHRDIFRGALLKALGYGSFMVDKLMDKLLLKDAMTNSVLSTTPDKSIADAAKVMLENKIGCLPVIDDGKLVGILTESDLLKSAT